MEIERLAAFAPQSRALFEGLGPDGFACLGCKDCRGLCAELVAALFVPESILSREGRK